MSTKRRPPAKLAHPVVKQSAKAPFQARINESKTSVSASSQPVRPTSTAETIDISSDSSSSYGDIPDSEEDVSEDEAGKDTRPGKNATDGTLPLGAKRLRQDADTEMLSPPQTRGREDPVEDSDDEAASPTFGELAQHHEVLDVAAALTAQQEPSPNSAAAGRTRVLVPPSTSSLGTVLNQALRTDDDDLLESCLNTTDMTTARNTINRLDSRLAGVLVAKLAARMHRRPGRAHNLMVWVQWTLVAHGAALAAQPDLLKTLAPLGRVLDERARGLERLLMLKGKLDMLEAQLQLRRMHRQQGRGRRGAHDSDDEADGRADEGVIYVEGDEDEGARPNGRQWRHDADDASPVANGVEDSEDDASVDDDGADEGEDVDVDSAESVDEDDVDHEDVESAEDDDSDVEAAAPPAKLRKTNKAFSKR